MERRTCGKSGIEISPMGIGCWAYGGGDYWGPQAQSDVTAVANAALDTGINFFDTAEGYNSGQSEEALGVALKGRRHEAVIGTKVSSLILLRYMDAAKRVSAGCKRIMLTSI